MKPFQKGDVIIFKAEDAWLSKAIAVLTDSDVSHAAMVYSDSSIVEVGGGGIVISNIDTARGEPAYVMRLKGSPDAAPLISSADNYLNTKVRYDFPELFLLAGLLLYKKIPLAPKLLSACSRIFMVAAYKLDEYIKHHSKHPEEPAMVCSQLVYQIFYDCGGEYRIIIKNGTFPRINSAANAESEARLIDLLQADGTDEENALPEDSLMNTSFDEEELAKELYEALTAANGPMEDFLPPADLPRTLKYAGSFFSKLQALLTAANSSLAPESMFVTPADLVYHAENLTAEGTISIQRV